MKTNEIEMYAIVEDEILKIIRDRGFNYVKSEYIEKKYGTEAWIFKTAYNFLAAEMKNRLYIDEVAESPIWVYGNEKLMHLSKNSHILKLAIPESEVLLFDYRRWNKILNLSYLGTPEEERNFKEKLSRQGVTEIDIIRTPFYPLLKKELLDSFRLLFTEEKIDATYKAGAVWKIKNEWIRDTLRI